TVSQVMIVGLSQMSERKTSVMTVVPVDAIITQTAASRAKPPVTVTRRVLTAGFLAWEPDRAIRKNDANVVASQATYRTIRSLARTRTSIASAKADIER